MTAPPKIQIQDLGVRATKSRSPLTGFRPRCAAQNRIANRQIRHLVDRIPSIHVPSRNMLGTTVVLAISLIILEGLLCWNGTLPNQLQEQGAHRLYSRGICDAARGCHSSAERSVGSRADAIEYSGAVSVLWAGRIPACDPDWLPLERCGVCPCYCTARTQSVRTQSKPEGSAYR